MPRPSMATPSATPIPVRLKLGLLLAGTVAVAVAMVSGALLRVWRDAIEDEVLHRGQVLARQLAKNAKEGLLFDDELLLHSYLAELAREEGVVLAEIFDAKGALRASTRLAVAGAPQGRTTAKVPRRRPEATAVAVPQSPPRRADSAAAPGNGPGGADAAAASKTVPPPSEEPTVVRDGEQFVLTVPVAVRRVRVGEVRLRLAPRAAIERAAARSLWAGLAVAGLLLAVGAAVAFVAGRRFVRPIERLAHGVARAATGDLTSEVPVTTRDEIGALTRNFNGMLRGLREREALAREKAQLTDAFRRYVSRDVADEILRDPEAVELGGQLRQVTVLFADIRGFTELAETMSPRDVVNILNKCFQIMADAIFAHGGTLDKFMGDCVMAVFGAPVQHPDHASRAVWTALAIRQAIDEENARRLAWGRYRPVTVGIGVDSGEAVVGNIGARDRVDYTAIGDCVNTAARLQALAPGGEIYVTEAVFERVGHEVAGTRLTPARLRGKGEPVAVYRIDGPREGGAALARARPAAEPEAPAGAGAARLEA
jgi:class 3 adenylate cyclase